MEGQSPFAGTQPSPFSTMRAARGAWGRRCVLVFSALLAPSSGLANQPIYYPVKGQSPQQYKPDLGQCQV